MDKDKNKDDLFEEARLESAKKLFKANAAESKEKALSAEQKGEVLTRAKEQLKSGETQWDLLQRMIDGSLTEKFITILNNMPDRDYVRNYLKLLEHFKPKITRKEGGISDSNEVKVSINALFVNEKGEKQLMSIDQIGKSDEQE